MNCDQTLQYSTKFKEFEYDDVLNDSAEDWKPASRYLKWRISSLFKSFCDTTSRFKVECFKKQFKLTEKRIVNDNNFKRAFCYQSSSITHFITTIFQCKTLFNLLTKFDWTLKYYSDSFSNARHFQMQERNLIERQDISENLKTSKFENNDVQTRRISQQDF